MNISGLWWACDVLQGQKPIPPIPPEEKVEGFQESGYIEKSRILLPKSSGNAVPTCKSSKNN